MAAAADVAGVDDKPKLANDNDVLSADFALKMFDPGAGWLDGVSDGFTPNGLVVVLVVGVVFALK